jgi:predicted DNA-binding transcriptional regulator AlpA
MTERLLDYNELRAIHGIPYTRRHLLNLEAVGAFPRRITFDGGAKVRWLQSEIEGWIAEQARTCRGSGRDPHLWGAARDIERGQT